MFLKLQWQKLKTFPSKSREKMSVSTEKMMSYAFWDYLEFDVHWQYIANIVIIHLKVIGTLLFS